MNQPSTVTPFRAKHHGQGRSEVEELKRRVDDLEARVEQLIVVLSDYGVSYNATARKISRYRKEGKI